MLDIDLNQLKESLEPDDIIAIIKNIEPSIEYEYGAAFIIFPTICHHSDILQASKKLYYYFNTRLFVCYTECDQSFDIYDLLERALILRQLPHEFIDILNLINKATDKINFDLSDSKSESYRSVIEKYKPTQNNIVFQHYPKYLPNVFPRYYHESWINDGLKPKSMYKYDIRFSPSKNQIVIPHHDKDGNLIGMRARNLDEIAILSGNKYMPMRINGQWYSHSLSYNLYALYQNKQNIQSVKAAWIFEGEKSAILCDGWFDNSIAVVTCGNKFNKVQLELLTALGVRDITICYDRMNERYDDLYFKKLWTLCEKYKNYVNMSFIYDRKGFLPYKAAPVDCGKDVFETLLKERINVL